MAETVSQLKHRVDRAHRYNILPWLEKLGILEFF